MNPESGESVAEDSLGNSSFVLPLCESVCCSRSHSTALRLNSENFPETELSFDSHSGLGC